MKYAYLLTFENSTDELVFLDESKAYYELIDVIGTDIDDYENLLSELCESYVNREKNHKESGGEYYFGCDDVGFVRKIKRA